MEIGEIWSPNDYALRVMVLWHVFYNTARKTLTMKFFFFIGVMCLYFTYKIFKVPFLLLGLFFTALNDL